MNRPITTLVVALTAASLCPFAAAQAEPGVIRDIAVNKAFAIYPSQNQITASRLTGDAAGVFTCCLTTQMAATALPDVVMGAYDQTKGTFTPTKEANALNTARSERALSVEPGLGRYAVLIRHDKNGPPFEYLFSARAKAGVAFPAAVPLAGVPKGTVGLSMGYVSGQLALFYSPPPYDKVLMHDLDISTLATPKLTGTPVVVARPSNTNHRIWLSEPVTGPDGDVEGLLLSEGATIFSASLLFQASLDPNRSGNVVVAGCGSSCSISFSTVAGGRFLFSTQAPQQPSTIRDVEVAWLLGDVVAPGGTADIVAAVSRSPKALTVLMMSTGVIPKIKLPQPFDVGHLGLDLSSSFVLGVLTHDDASQRAQLRFPVPNEARLRGVDAALQGLSFDSSGQPLAWTNTAWCSVR